MIDRALPALCIAAALTATALGQDDAPPAPATPATQADAPKDSDTDAGGDLLAGPKVVEAAGAATADRDGKQADIMPRKWFMLLRELGLRAEQRAMVRRITGELAAERKAYNEKYGADLKTIRVRMRERRQRAESPSIEDRERLARMLEQAPKAEPYQERVWKILTDEQKAKMEQLIDEEIKARQKRRRDVMGDTDEKKTDRVTDAARGDDRDERAKRRSRFLSERRARAKGDTPN